MNILLVEDEKRLSEVLVKILQENKYTVDAVKNGSDGLLYAQKGQYDVIILDVMLPEKSGLEIARTLRQEDNKTPILMLTARSEVSDRVAGLDSGADDYLTKPFAIEELLARVRALSRRQAEMQMETLKFGDITLKLSTHDICLGSKSVRLNRKEFDVIQMLMINSKSIVSKEMLITKVWGFDSDAEANNVEAYISFLRKKLAYLQSKVKISTIWKVGYRLEWEDS